MIDYDRIISNLYVGTYPQDLKDIQELKERLRVTAVLNLQTDEDLRQRGIDWAAMEALYKKLGMEVHRVPMRDFDYDDQKERLPQAVHTLSKLLASNHIIYLHCNAGVGRSPLVAMAYLHWCRDMSLEQAVKQVKDCRDCAPYEELLLAHPNLDLGSSGSGNRGED
jgi:protein-tyrosine phosphatase